MFKFEFSSQQCPTETDCVWTVENENSNIVEWSPAKEVSVSEGKIIDYEDAVDSITIGLRKLLYIKPPSVLQAIKEEKALSDSNILLAEQINSDLMPSKYEGGFKVWECTHDVAISLENTEICGKTVLDLGCGIGLLGILALKRAADLVHFQDYNEDVLHYATIPNVLLNTDSKMTSCCKFFSGDWESFANLTTQSYDLIVTSETIYNPANYQKLHSTIQRLLAPSGIVLLGAKSYYFGVGGSTRQFEKFVQERDVFNVQTVWKCTTGVQREILRLNFKANQSPS